EGDWGSWCPSLNSVRNAAVAVFVALATVVAALVYLGSARPESGAVPSPTPATVLSASPSASTSGPSSTSSASALPSATTSGALGAATIQVTRTIVPAEFRYLVLGSGEEFRLVVLDLKA